MRGANDMNQKKMTWKRIVAVFSAVVLLATTIPVENLKAASDINFSLSDTAVDLVKGGESHTVTATVAANEGETLVENEISWTSGNKAIAVVTKEGKITAVGKGETKITATCSYVIQTAAGMTEKGKKEETVTVTVYEKPELKLTIEKEIQYPDQSTVKLEGVPEGVSCVIGVESVETKKEITSKTLVGTGKTLEYQVSLDAGSYTIKASTKKSEYYVAADAENITHKVGYGNTGFNVTATETEVYCGESVTYTLQSSMDGIVEVKKDGTVLEKINIANGEKSTYSYKCEEEVDTKITFEFKGTANPANYYTAVEMPLKANRIELIAEWSNLERDYDGTNIFKTTAVPEVKRADNLLTDSNMPRVAESVNEDGYAFELEEAGIGTYTVAVKEKLTLSGKNSKYYKLKEENPEATITINPKELNVTQINVSEFFVVGKQFDGSSVVKEAETSKVVFSDTTGIIEQEKETASVFYEAHYAVKKAKGYELTSGDSQKDIKANMIVLSNLGIKIGDKVSANYCFNEAVITLDGEYTISCNDDFFAFTGIKEREIGFSWIDKMLWVKEKEIRKKGFKFATNKEEKNEFEEQDFKNSVEIKDGDSTYIYAMNEAGLISQYVHIVGDQTAPTGQIYVQYTEGKKEENITVNKLWENYTTILEKTDAVDIVLQSPDKDIVEIEWYGTNEPAKVVDDAYWAGIDPEKIEKFTSDNNGIMLTLSQIEAGQDVKKFYYVKLVDQAGNVTYVKSEGILKDITAPTIDEVSLSEMEAVFEDIPVYTGDDGKVNVGLKFTVNEPKLKEESAVVNSGISSLEVTLKKWNNGKYQTIGSSLTWTEDSREIQNKINELEKTGATNAQIEVVSGELNLEGTFEKLQDGKYQIEIQAADKAGNKADTKTKEFYVDTKAPEIDINTSGLEENKNPNKEKNTYTGGNLVITVSDLTLKTTSLLGFDSDIEWIESTKADGSIVKTATFGRMQGEKMNELSDGIYTFLVNAEDATGKDTKKEYTFTYDDVNPCYTVAFSDTALDSITENDGNTLYHNDTITATFLIDEETSYNENKIQIQVRNNAGEVVASWGITSEDSAKENADELIYIEHESGSKEFKVVIRKDDQDHSTDDDGYTFTIHGCDDTGNVLEAKVIKADDQQTDYGKELAKVRVLDTVAPDLTDVSYVYTTKDEIAQFHTVNSTDYVNDDTTLIFTLKEHNPYKSVYTLTSEEEEEAKILEWSKLSSDAKTKDDMYTTRYSVPQRGVKGDEQTFTLTIQDKAGNKAIMSGEKRSETNTVFTENEGEFKDSFVVDKVAPIITYQYKDENPNNTNVDGVDYFKNKAEVEIRVEEHNFDSSCVDITVTPKSDDKVAYEESEWKTEGDTYTKTFVFENDNEYLITVDGTDCAWNDFVLGEVDSKITVMENEKGTTVLNLAVDKTLSAVGDNKKPIVVIKPVTNPGTTVDTQKLYNTDVTYEVSVYDPKVNNYASGVDGIKFDVTSEEGTKSEAVVEKDGTIKEKAGLTVEIQEGVAGNLAQGEENRYVYYVTISKDTFNSNGIKLEVTATDISTNSTKIATEEIAVDTTKPEVTLHYNNNDVHNEKYFDKGRTLTIEVKERNFSNDCLNLYVNNKRINLKFALREVGTGNRDDSVWVASYTIEKDGDYIIRCDGNDRVGNEANVHYEGVAVKKFTVDKTKPVMSLSFNNNNAQNGSYYSSARTATITINEHNFRGSDLKITGTANNAGAGATFPGISKWSSKGDVHKATITFKDDALYTLELAYSDLATNEAKAPEKQTFTVDNTDPVINISGVAQGGAYPDAVIPKISFGDNNYLSNTVTLTRTSMDKVNEDVTSKFVKSSGVRVDGTGKGTGANTIEDIKHEQENDGIYTLTVTVKDKAGRSKTQVVTYSVNRFGSVYVYSKDLQGMLNGYTQLEDIEDKNLYIEAYNANELVDESTKLEITCDGVALSGQLSKADVKASKLKTNGWHAYRFKLNAKDFAKEGRYVVTISDKDSAGNVQTNSDNPVEFFIDGTDPKLESVIGLEEQRYNVAEQIVKYVVSDTMGIAKIEIYIDDKLIDTIDEFENAASYEGEFTVAESSSRQKIRIVVTDKSGKVLDTDSEKFANEELGYVFNSNIMVSTSLFDLWYDNKPLFWGTIAGVAAVAAVILLILLGKKKKEEDEEDDAA